jgi:fibronectin-binding autotransporter adhesin
MPVSNLTLCNVTIATPAKTFDIYNAQGIQIIDSPLAAPNTTANTLTLYNAQVTVTNSTAGTNLVTLSGLAAPPVNNVLAFYNTTAAINNTGMLGSNSITLGGSSLAFNQNSVAFSNNLSIISASTLAMTSGSNSFGGAFLGSGPLALSLPASSSLTLRGDSSGFSGDLTVTNGTLLVNNTTGSGTGSGAVTVLGAATLGGNGFIGGPLTVNGTLAPGNSPGTLTVNNDLVVNGGAVLQYQLGASSDLTVVNGNLTLGGTLNITNNGGLGAANYTLFTYAGSLSGATTLGTTPPGYSYYLNTNTAGQVILAAYSPASTPPGFTAISSHAGNIVLSGGGGSTNGPYYVLTSTNVALPRSQWTPSAFSQFDSNGNFVFTNAPGTGTRQRFYMLQLP